MNRNKKNSPFTHTPVTGRFEHKGINFRVNVTAETNPCEDVITSTKDLIVRKAITIPPVSVRNARTEKVYITRQNDL